MRGAMVIAAHFTEASAPVSSSGAIGRSCDGAVQLPVVPSVRGTESRNLREKTRAFAAQDNAAAGLQWVPTLMETRSDLARFDGSPLFRRLSRSCRGGAYARTGPDHSKLAVVLEPLNLGRGEDCRPRRKA